MSNPAAPAPHAVSAPSAGSASPGGSVPSAGLVPPAAPEAFTEGAGAEGAVSAVAAASAADAVAHFAGRLAFETDVSDVAADLAAGAPGIVVVDSRGDESWDQGHVPGAVHIPTREIAERAPELIGRDVTVVVYCWGPGCNGATKAALEFARLGYPVKEMIGGFEYWAREGLPVETGPGEVARRAPDPLTAPVPAPACAC